MRPRTSSRTDEITTAFGPERELEVGPWDDRPPIPWEACRQICCIIADYVSASASRAGAVHPAARTARSGFSYSIDVLRSDFPSLK